VRLRVNLQGHVAEWSTSGAGELSAWLASHPWQSGGICAIHCADDAPEELIVDAISRAAHAANQGVTRLRVERFERGSEPDVSPVRQLKSRLSVDEGLAHYEAVRALKKEISAYSFVFVFSTHSKFDPAWWWELRSVADLLAKGEPAIGLCAAILDPIRMIDSVSCFDFQSAHPDSEVLCDPDDSDSLRWRRYLHQRIAWESGGNITAAYWIDEFVKGIRLGDDSDLETRLGAAADSLMKSKEVEALVHEHLGRMDSVGTNVLPFDADNTQSRLSKSGVLWRPPLGSSLEVVPWACRAVLRAAKSSHSLDRLRSNLVCAPLRGEIFQLCLRAESAVRQSLVRRTKRSPAPVSSANAIDRLIRGHDECLHYPPGYPMPPVRAGDEWTFATFGEFLNAHHSGDVLEHHRRLLGLRNAVAHGHYMTWRHVQMAADIRLALSI
jgi:hypothetical protein